MPDKENVIKKLHDARRYLEDKEWSDRGASPHIDAINDVLALLKEDCHNCKLECLLQRYDQLKEKYDKLLKEWEAVKPRVSSVEQRCGNCNKVIEMDGWIACPWCGKPIDWEGWWKKNGTRNQDT